MAYGQFVKDLNKGIEGRILGYDQLREDGGYILYMKGMPRTICIPPEAVDHEKSESIALLRARIRQGEWRQRHMVLKLNAGRLTLSGGDEPVPYHESAPCR